jgi:hypothetical protein
MKRKIPKAGKREFSIAFNNYEDREGVDEDRGGAKDVGAVVS